MNLHGIVAGAIGAINPFVPAVISVSAGYSIIADGSQVPIYLAPIVGTAQVQAQSFKDIEQLDGVNQNGQMRSIYFYGAYNAVVRALSKGGDILTLSDGPNVGTWLITQVLEQWPDWCKVAVTFQNGS